MTALHHQLGLLGALFCLGTLIIFVWQVRRDRRAQREMKRRRLNQIFDGVVPHRK